MRILMLGNSFTYYRHMPDTLARFTGAEVVQHTHAKAGLSEHLDPETELGAKTLAALKDEKWDYVVLQEFSTGPIINQEDFFSSVSRLCELIRENGATPILYATWAYQKDGKKMAAMDLSYDEMFEALYKAYHEAAEQNHALVADVGQKFYQLSEELDLYAKELDLYAKDGYHPNEQGARVAAKVLAEVIDADRKAQRPAESALPDAKSNEASDTRLRLFYLYRMLEEYTDDINMLSTKQITSMMMEQHGILEHRTTVAKDVELLRAAGVDITSDRRQGWNYAMGGRLFSVPELKILIDAVQSSKLISEKKSREMISKLLTLTSTANADKLKRTVHVSDRTKSDNEKSYYIVDAIQRAITLDVKIAFFYFDYDNRKTRVLKNGGKPYTVSPYDLIWDGDYYYLIGFCDERDAVRTFRVDRILERPRVLREEAISKPESYDVSRYTKESFRMYAAQDAVEVTLRCEGHAMNALIDKFGFSVNTEPLEENRFRAYVTVCPGPTFYRWVFGWGNAIRIEAPECICQAYREMLQEAMGAL